MSYIYFIQAVNDGPIKIGITQSFPTKRMVKIQSDCPWPVKLLGTIKGTISQEKQIHSALAYFRAQGEWFEPHPIVIAAIKLALEIGMAVPSPPPKAKHRHPLCEYRVARGLTLCDVAKQTGLSAAALSRFENGRNKPCGASLKELIRVTGLSVLDLRPDLVALEAGRC